MSYAKVPKGRGMAAVLALSSILVAASAWAGFDNDGTCPVLTGQEDLAELWSATDFVRMDMNGPTADCAAALADYSLFAHDGIPDIVQLILIQSAIEANVSLGGVEVAAMYEASANALCADFDDGYAETLSGMAMISADSRSFVQCAILGLSMIMTGVPVFADTSDNPDTGFAYFAPAADFDSDGTSNLAEWVAALATVGITDTDVFTYDDTAWGLVWENAKRGGVGGDTALQAFLTSNGLSLPQSLLFYPLATAPMGPPPVPGWQLRIASWNIQFLNTRTPPRTASQLQALAERMAGFDAAVLCLQEINETSVLEGVMTTMGPSYDAVYFGSSQNAIVYDTTKVTLVDSAAVDFLTAPPYSSYATDYPAATEFPFSPPDRIPSTAVFQSIAGGETFRVIDFHGHWSSALCRQYEGVALNLYVSELLANPAENHRVFVIGDYNGEPNYSPEPELFTGAVMSAVPSENGECSHTSLAASIDHVSVTPDAMALIPDGTLYVVRPRVYGETNREFFDTHSDHLPLLIEIGVTDPMPVTSSWVALAGLILIVGVVGVCFGFRVWVARTD